MPERLPQRPSSMRVKEQEHVLFFSLFEPTQKRDTEDVSWFHCVEFTRKESGTGSWYYFISKHGIIF